MKLSFLSVLLIFVFSFSAFSQTESERDKGVRLYGQGEYEKAVEVLQNSLKAEEQDRVAWTYLGASFVKLKKNDDAVKAFRKMDGIFSKNTPVYDKDLKITSKPHAGYNQTARSNLIVGTVKIAVEFGADGEIGFAFPFQTLPYGLTETVVKAAKSIKFEPAVQNGKPVTVVKMLVYKFDIY